MITDQEILKAVEDSFQSEYMPLGCYLVSVRHNALNRMILRFRLDEGGHVYRLQLPLPTSLELKPWLTSRPSDATQAALDLRNFLVEEFDTGAKTWAFLLDVEGELEFILEPYGLRRADRLEHLRLSAAAGRDGWWAFVMENDSRGLDD